MPKNLKDDNRNRNSSEEEFRSLMEIENYFTPNAFEKQVSDQSGKKSGQISMINILSHLE